jgi:branched-chain amino acid transport system permease protein
VAQAIVLGVLAGSVFGLASVGLSAVFGVMRMVNFAHGDFIMVGMYIAYAVSSGLRWNVYLSLPFVIIAMAIFGYVVFKILFAKAAIGGQHNNQLIISLALAILLEALAQQVFGSDPRIVPGPKGGPSIGSLVLPTAQLVGFGVAVACMVLLEIGLNRTRHGRALRGVVSNRETATLVGIPVGSYYTLAFMISAVLAGISGVVLAAYYPVTPDVGLTFVLLSFVCVLLGGAGDIMGTFIAGLIVGVVESLTATFWHPTYQDVTVYALFIVLVLLLPRGIRGNGRI